MNSINKISELSICFLKLSSIDDEEYDNYDENSSDDEQTNKIPPYWSTNFDYLHIPVDDKTHESFAPYTHSDMHNTFSYKYFDEFLKLAQQKNKKSKLLQKWIKKFKEKYKTELNNSIDIDNIPLVGVYDNWTGFRGVSPTDNTIGLFNI